MHFSASSSRRGRRVALALSAGALIVTAVATELQPRPSLVADRFVIESTLARLEHAVLAGDGRTACRLLTAARRAQVVRQYGTAHPDARVDRCEDAVHRDGGTDATADARLERTGPPLWASITVAGDRAVASGPVRVHYVLVRRDGRWLVDLDPVGDDIGRTPDGRVAHP